MEKNSAYERAFTSYCSGLVDSIIDNSIPTLKENMESNFYSSIPKSEKEFEAFKNVYKFRFGANELLQYLIFDYKISEANSIDKITVDDTVKAMFEARNLTIELSTELENGNKHNKRAKV